MSYETAVMVCEISDKMYDFAAKQTNDHDIDLIASLIATVMDCDYNDVYNKVWHLRQNANK